MFYDRLLNADGKKQFSPLPDPGKHGIVLRPVSGGDKDEADNDASGNSDNSSSNFHQIDHRGQMTVLMRQAGLNVPGVYGPSLEGWTSVGTNPPEV